MKTPLIEGKSQRLVYPTRTSVAIKKSIVRKIPAASVIFGFDKKEELAV